MRSQLVTSSLLLALVAAACNPSGQGGARAGGAGGSAGGGAGGAGGVDGGGLRVDGSGAVVDSGQSAGGGRDGGAGPVNSTTPFCERWRATAMVAGGLPGFATDSDCVDFAELPLGDVPCSGRRSASVQIAEVHLGQTHLLAPSSADITMNDAGEPLAATSVRPQFRLVTHRPALLKVGLTGEGPSPEVQVTARRQGAVLGSLCLAGPESLAPARAPGHRFDDSFTVTLPATWLRPGLELELRAGMATRTIPAAELRVAGGVRHMVVDMPVQIFNDPRTYPLSRFSARYASMLPVQSLIWSRFPVPVVIDPFVLPPTADKPARIQEMQARDFAEMGEVLDIGSIIQRANGQNKDTSYYGNLGPRYGGGLGVVGGNAASGSNGRPIFRHELGHTYGLNHLEPMYDAKQYPYLRNREGKGGGVGPFWALMQLERLIFSPYDDADPMLFKRDAMAGGDGADNFHGHFTVQVITDYMQDRVFWDDDRRAYLRYDAQTGEFTPEPQRDDGWYFRAVQRDVPVYTVWGYYSDAVPEVNVIQPSLHYRGNLMRIMDPTNDMHLQWLRAHPGLLCNTGCDFIVRVTFADGAQRTFLHNRESRPFTRWAMNVPAEGKLTRVQLFRRVLKNDAAGTAAPEHVSKTTGATVMNAATLVAERTFN